MGGGRGGGSGAGRFLAPPRRPSAGDRCLGFVSSLLLVLWSSLPDDPMEDLRLSVLGACFSRGGFLGSSRVVADLAPLRLRKRLRRLQVAQAWTASQSVEDPVDFAELLLQRTRLLGYRINVDPADLHLKISETSNLGM